MIDLYYTAFLRQKNYEKIKNAKRSALAAFSDAPFSFLFASLVTLTFVLGFYWLYRIISMAFVYLELDGFFVMFICYFIAAPVFMGLFRFISEFLLTKRKYFNIIFYCYASPREFLRSLTGSLYALACAGLFVLIFYAVCALPGLFNISDRNLLIFGIIAVVLLCFLALACASLICLGRMKNGGISFFGSFWFHYIIVYFTKGIYLVFLLPYIIICLINFKTEKEESP